MCAVGAPEVIGGGGVVAGEVAGGGGVFAPTLTQGTAAFADTAIPQFASAAQIGYFQAMISAGEAAGIGDIPLLEEELAIEIEKAVAGEMAPGTIVSLLASLFP